MAAALAGLRDLYADTSGRVPSTLFLCCNGPSLGEIDLERLRVPGVVTMGVNNGGHVIRPDLWACVDHPARFMPSIWRDPRILKFLPAGNEKKPILDPDSGAPGEMLARDCPGVVTFPHAKSFRPALWLAEPRVVYGQGGERFCVMLAALKIAWVLGFRRVYLLGVDWEYEASRAYFFDEDRTEGQARSNRKLFITVSGYLNKLRPFFEREGFQVYNCNPRSGLRVFEYRELDRALEGVAVPLGGSTRGMYVPR